MYILKPLLEDKYLQRITTIQAKVLPLTVVLYTTPLRPTVALLPTNAIAPAFQPPNSALGQNPSAGAARTSISWCSQAFLRTYQSAKITLLRTYTKPKASFDLDKSQRQTTAQTTCSGSEGNEKRGVQGSAQSTGWSGQR